MTDEELMDRYRRGDEQAFDALYARYRGPVYRYIVRLLNSQNDPDAAFQDCWLKVVRYRAKWSIDQPLRPWLFRIAHNCAIDTMRASQRSLTDADERIADFPSDQHPAEQWQFIRDCVERLLQLLAEMPALQRDAFLLKEEAGLSLRDIAEVADVGRETIKSRLRYAMNTLRKGLEGCEHV
jgi:RNA polymerase sigma-70 factor (ECF subfamily)